MNLWEGLTIIHSRKNSKLVMLSQTTEPSLSVFIMQGRGSAANYSINARVAEVTSRKALHRNTPGIAAPNRLRKESGQSAL